MKWLNKNNMKSIDIPIPPQETQTQVVQTLDDLANLRHHYMDIRDGLERRIKYYFEMMITRHRGEITMEKLGDVCEIEQGTSLPKKNMVNGDYKVIGGGKVIGTHNINNRNGAETTITRVGELTVTFINEKFYLTENGFSIKHSNNITNRFIYYLLANTSLKSSLRLLYGGSGQPVISKTKVEQFEIPIPPQEIQTQIVQTLDNLEAEKNKITETLHQLDTEMREILAQSYQSYDMTDAPDLINTLEEVNAPDLINTLEEVNASDLINTLEEVNAPDLINTLEEVNASDLINTLEEVNTRSTFKNTHNIKFTIKR